MFPNATLHEDLLDLLTEALTGSDVVSMALRSIIVYVFALFLVHAGKSRMLSETTVFDIILVFVLGSMLSRAINGTAPLVATFVAAGVLVALHALFSRTAYHHHGFGKLIKGNADVLVRDGEVHEAALHQHHISQRDLDEAMHKAGVTAVSDIKVARFERDGSISVVPRVRVLEVEVEEGVQRVRIEV